MTTKRFPSAPLRASLDQAGSGRWHTKNVPIRSAAGVIGSALGSYGDLPNSV